MRSRCWHKPIGEILVERRLVTRAQLALALSLQERLPEHRLGKILVDLGCLKMRDVSRAHAEQLQTTFARAWAGWRET